MSASHEEKQAMMDEDIARGIPATQTILITFVDMNEEPCIERVSHILAALLIHHSMAQMASELGWEVTGLLDCS